MGKGLLKEMTLCGGLFSLLVFPAASGWAQTAKSTQVHEQIHFSAEDNSVMRQIKLPRGVVRILVTDPLVINVLKFYKIAPQETPRNWFSASEVHLDGPSEVDIVVEGEKELRAANINPFWVFRRTGQTYKLVFSLGCHDLEIMNTRSNGLRDIQIISATATMVSSTICQFDGHKYVADSSKTEPTG